LSRPDFFIVGAPKCGTSALTHCLNQHPEIFMPEGRDPTYFGSDLYKENPPSLSDYLSFFERAGSARRVGETSVWYLYSKRAAAEIEAFDPDARIIIMLRNPVDKMYSHHSQLVYSGNEDIENFEAALGAEPYRREGLRIPQTNHRPEGLLYREAARFAGQVERYLNVFGRERLHVVVYGDFHHDAPATYRRILEFLGVSPDFEPRFTVVNPNKYTRSKALRSFLQEPPETMRSLTRSVLPGLVRYRVKEVARRFNTRYEPRPPMDPELGRRLRREFAPEVERLGGLLDRDLSHWSED
jgi:hypothetical protein